MLAHRSIPPRNPADAIWHIDLLLRRLGQRPTRMAARPYGVPHARAVALRRLDAPAARRRYQLQRRRAMVRRPAGLPPWHRRRGAMQRLLARRVWPGLLDGES